MDTTIRNPPGDKPIDPQPRPPLLPTVETGPMAPSDPPSPTKTTKHGFRFWALLFSLAIVSLLMSIEGTIITNTLPTIVSDLGGGALYSWIANAFFLSSVATLPLYGHASDIFGRRWLMIGAVTVFTLGGGLAGGANSIGMLIAARTIQGLGGGGIGMLAEVIVTDLVPLRERGKYLAIVMITVVLGAALGPFLGGVFIKYTTWRWVFWINLPIGGVSLVLLFLFLHTNFQRGQSMLHRLARIDWTGNVIFILANVAILIALTWGGAVYAWSSYRVIVPLVLGFLGLGGFVVFEWSLKVCPEPSFPKVLVSNRTSAAAMFLSFIHSICLYWSVYFIPIYFQAVRRADPMDSGVYSLPIFLGTVPAAMVGGVLLSKWGRYKPLHIFGFAMTIVAFGLLSMLDEKSSTAAWVCFQLVNALGLGTLASILLPAVQAPLDESLVALATSTWSFARGFSALFAFTIPSVVFNNESARLADDISDTSIAVLLKGGQAYQYATADFVNSIANPDVRQQVMHLFSRCLRMVWLIGLVFAGAGFLAVFLEREVKLRKELNTEYGLAEKNTSRQGQKVPSDGSRNIPGTSTSSTAVSV